MTTGSRGSGTVSDAAAEALRAPRFLAPLWAVFFLVATAPPPGRRPGSVPRAAEEARPPVRSAYETQEPASVRWPCFSSHLRFASRPLPRRRGGWNGSGLRLRPPLFGRRAGSAIPALRIRLSTVSDGWAPTLGQ